MSTKFFSLSSLMEKKRKPQPQESRDELALVKAAAWAWYQHGSRSERKKSSNEFDVTRTQRSPRPSRYKLEAMRMAKVTDLTCNGLEVGTITNNKSLLDTYEVQSISRQFDSLIESSNNKHVDDNCKCAKNDNGDRRMNNKKRFINFKGFWSRNVVVCGGGNDVVDGSALRGDQLSVKHSCTSS